MLGAWLRWLLAVLLNVKVRGTALFRTAFYLPSIISGVALVMIWKWIYSKDYGLLNYGLSLLGVEGPNWLGDPHWSILAIIIASLWGLGGTMLILLMLAAPGGIVGSARQLRARLAVRAQRPADGPIPTPTTGGTP